MENSSEQPTKIPALRDQTITQLTDTLDIIQESGKCHKETTGQRVMGSEDAI